MTTFTVANSSQLNSALASARGGDTVVLKDGNYGSIRVTADYASTVTIRAENPQDATIGTLQVWGGSNMRFDGIQFDSGMNGGSGRGVVSIENGSRNIAIVNSEVTGSRDGVYAGHYGVYVRNSDGVTIQNNNIHDADSGVVIFGGANANVSGNTLDYFGRDVMKFSGLSDSTISGNKSSGHVFPWGSIHNDFIQFEGSSNNVAITDNTFIAAKTGALQGIFLSDGSYSGFTIDNNLIYTGMLRGISISSGRDNVITDNTLLNAAGTVHKGTEIFAPGGTVIDNNVFTKYAGGTAGSNLIVQNIKPDAPYYVDDYFVNASTGLGPSIQDLRPIAGSLADGKGADAKATAAPPAPGKPAAPTAPADGDGIAINAGGKAGGGFAADAFYSGGTAYATAAAIANTTADAIYQSERYGNFRYAAPVEDGTYEVTLKFAELVWTGAGERVFDVKAEGRTVLDDYDIFREAGGRNVAVDETFRVAVTDGELDLEFLSVVENAKVGGIEIDLL